MITLITRTHRDLGSPHWILHPVRYGSMQYLFTVFPPAAVTLYGALILRTGLWHAKSSVIAAVRYAPAWRGARLQGSTYRSVTAGYRQNLPIPLLGGNTYRR